MKLAVIATHVERLAGERASATSRYAHLNCIAGVGSSPPSAVALKAAGYQRATPPAGAGAALSLGDAADACAGRVLARLPAEATASVGQLLHCQATLGEQMLASVCLRIATARLPQVQRAVTLDQVGTAGVATALQLATLPVADGRGITVITAADCWHMPFSGDFTPLVRFADAAAALVVAPAEAAWPALAHIEAVASQLTPQRGPFWRRAPARVGNQLRQTLLPVVANVLGRAGWHGDEVELLLGEPIASGIGEAIADGLGRPDVPSCDGDAAHLASAALVASIETAIAVATSRQRTVRCLLWCASPDGNVAALALTAYPQTATVV